MDMLMIDVHNVVGTMFILLGRYQRFFISDQVVGMDMLIIDVHNVVGSMFILLSRSSK